MSWVEVDEIGNEMFLNLQSVVDVLEMVLNLDELILNILVGVDLLFKFANLNCCRRGQNQCS